jgi:Ca2+-binding EF-hand superfamily protein
MLRYLDMAMTEDEIEALIDEADANHDGAIDYSEFYTMMCAVDNTA